MRFYLETQPDGTLVLLNEYLERLGSTYVDSIAAERDLLPRGSVIGSPYPGHGGIELREVTQPDLPDESAFSALLRREQEGARSGATRALIDTADGQRPVGPGFEPVARTDDQARGALRLLGERWAAGDATAGTYLATIGYDDPADVASDTH